MLISRYQMQPRNEVILIRCDSETARMFRVFVAENGFKCYGDALKFILEQVIRLKLRPGAGYR
jgi:hypothetical protein